MPDLLLILLIFYMLTFMMKYGGVLALKPVWVFPQIVIGLLMKEEQIEFINILLKQHTNIVGY